MNIYKENILKNKLSLITGSSRGIGKAIAIKLASMGSDIIINFLKNKEEAEKTKREIEEKTNSRSYLFQADMDKEEDIKNMFKYISENFYKLDILVNNAAFGALGSFKKLGKFMWNKTMNINTTAILLCSQQAAKLMKDGGRIINISSLGSQKYIENYMPIGTVKAAIESMTRYMAYELVSENIYVNCVSGGIIDTDALNYFKNSEELKEEAINKTPLKRLGKPEDIANVVAFLCTEESNWIVGQTIIVDGGLSLSI
jgi:enoyl-[acyl-carrier protein] reductase III